MAVGPGFNNPATQARLAKEQGQPVPPETEPAAQQPVIDPVVDDPRVITPEVEDTETPSVEPTETDESAAADADKPETNLDMDDVPAAQSQEEIDKALADAGFSNDDLGQELAENDGKLTDATIKALKEKFDPEAVDNAVKDMEAQWADAQPERDSLEAKAVAKVEAMNDYIYGSLAKGDTAKGKEHFATLAAWADKNMSAEDKSTVNALLRSGDKLAVKRGLEMAVNQWKKGQEKPMMSGDADATVAPAAPAFVPLSKDEFIKITCSEKYEKDAEYAKSIDDRRRKTMATEGAITPEYSHLRPPI